jgi:hypothetical protein
MNKEIEVKQPQPVTTPGTRVYYNKSQFFRVIHVTGMYGGPTPVKDEIMMTVFNDRSPFPEQTMNDTSGSEILKERVVKQGLERELESSLVMNLAVAKIMYKWLGDAIAKVEPQQKRVE